MAALSDAEVERMMVSAAATGPMVLDWSDVDPAEAARLLADREAILARLEDELFQFGVIVNAEGLLASQTYAAASDPEIIGLMGRWREVRDFVARLKAAQARRSQTH